MRGFLAAFAAVALATAPVAGAAEPGGGVPPSFARAIADATAGQEFGNGPGDKMVFFSGTGDQTRIIAIGALATGEALPPEVPEGAEAVLRTRAAGGARAPDPADIEWARRTGLTVYVAGEWSTPPALWQISREGGAVQMREIDRRGRAGAWQPAAAQ